MTFNQSKRAQIVVVGAGFAGLTATRALARAPVDITLVDRANHHTFQPLLYQVATAGLSAPQIASPVRHILRRQRNARVLLGEAIGIDEANRTLLLSDLRLPYDFLIVASGVTHSYFGQSAWAEYAPGLKTLDDALEIRRRLLLAFENAERTTDLVERNAWLTFAIVGAGPTGVELAGTLAEIARHTLRGEFRAIDPSQARVMLLEGGARVLPTYTEALSRRAESQLVRLGVEVRTGARVTDIGREGVQIGDDRIAARTVIWAAGVQATAFGRSLPGPHDRAGRVQVSPTLQIPGHDSIFVLGDLAAVGTGATAVPGVAYAAKQMGAYAARCIRLQLEGKPQPSPFIYKDRGSLATIGRNAAIAMFPSGIRLSGRLAWWAWLVVHIFFLIGFRNRLLTLIDWAWSYMTYQRQARLILVSDKENDPSRETSLAQ